MKFNLWARQQIMVECKVNVILMPVPFWSMQTGWVQWLLGHPPCRQTLRVDILHGLWRDGSWSPRYGLSQVLSTRIEQNDERYTTMHIYLQSTGKMMWNCGQIHWCHWKISRGTNGSMNRYRRLTNFPTFRFNIHVHIEPDWQEIVMKYKFITLAMLSFCMLSWLRSLAYSSAMYSAASLVRLGFSAFATWIYFLMNCMLTILKLRRQNLISNVRYTYL